MTKADVESSVLTICKTFDKITADKVRSCNTIYSLKIYDNWYLDNNQDINNKYYI